MKGVHMPNPIRPLGKNQLLDVILRAVDQSGWQALTLSSKHPFRLRVHGEEGLPGFDKVREADMQIKPGSWRLRSTSELGSLGQSSIIHCPNQAAR